MRYEKGHKDATRRRIVEVAAQHLRKEGVGATQVGVLKPEDNKVLTVTIPVWRGKE